MKIVEQECCHFKEIKIGEVFVYKNELFMKIHSIGDDNGVDSGANAISLFDYLVMEFREDDVVQEIDAELHIK